MNASSDDEGNNDEVALNLPTKDININDNYDDEGNDYEGTPDTPTGSVNNKTIDNDEEKKIYEDEADRGKGNENLNMKANDKETEETEETEEDAPDLPTTDVNINDGSDDEKNDYEVTADTPKYGVNNETIDNDKDKNYEDEAEKETGNEILTVKANDKETEKTEVNEEDEENEEDKHET